MKYPNIIFLAADSLSAHIIQRFKGKCLLCDNGTTAHDLNFCIGHEVWVVYANKAHFMSAMQLARTAQWIGAAKVFSILVDARLAQEVNHEE